LWFVEELKNLAIRVKTILMTNIPMVNLTSDEWEKFNNATHRHICEKPFTQEDDTRVRDHCHLTRRYRGPAHSNCNLITKNLFAFPVFHNLSGYAAHFIIKDIATAFEGEIELLPITKEKYISFTKTVDLKKDNWKNHVKLRFIDSYKFLTASFDKLASYLDKDKLKILKSEFQNLSAENFSLLTRKGVFPYEYVDSVDR